jgi:hypothetical protein
VQARARLLPLPASIPLAESAVPAAPCLVLAPNTACAYPILSSPILSHPFRSTHSTRAARQVTALGGEEYSARVIGVDRDKDIAVLQVRW